MKPLHPLSIALGFEMVLQSCVFLGQRETEFVANLTVSKFGLPGRKGSLRLEGFVYLNRYNVITILLEKALLAMFLDSKRKKIFSMSECSEQLTTASVCHKNQQYKSFQRENMDSHHFQVHMILSKIPKRRPHC